MASASHFELLLSVTPHTDGFTVCWRNDPLYHRALGGERIELSIRDEHGVDWDVVVEREDAIQTFVFKTLEEAQLFVESLMSIRITITSRRDD